MFNNNNNNAHLNLQEYMVFLEICMSAPAPVYQTWFCAPQMNEALTCGFVLVWTWTQFIEISFFSFFGGLHTIHVLTCETRKPSVCPEVLSSVLRVESICVCVCRAARMWKRWIFKTAQWCATLKCSSFERVIKVGHSHHYPGPVLALQQWLSL